MDVSFTLITAGSFVVFFLSLYLVCSQIVVDDVDYIEAMIPHHSIAILKSKRAQIKDSRVSNLADGIIKTQKKEIAETRKLIEDLKDQ
ncbi:DUF305 domain-containing protein [Rossellomorea aquimaris]|uniref:DUF305 domain-containing protein n=1 Tax=Rossellomorea aquimaris TaxID=189382 RepID=UPI001CD28A71|nr:DUF305 domain-containing protein [Rossellomorea aquimaris]MCA1054042.1 DUF305 domain-containing protein [Rossellomorea aquimaris]